jgi:hypothetical protein
MLLLTGTLPASRSVLTCSVLEVDALYVLQAPFPRLNFSINFPPPPIPPNNLITIVV